MNDKETTWVSNGSAEGVVPPLPSPQGSSPAAPDSAPTLDISSLAPAPQPPALATTPQPPANLAEALSQQTGVPLIPSFANLDPSNPFGVKAAPETPAPPLAGAAQVPNLAAIPGYEEFNRQFQALTGQPLQDAVTQINQMAAMLPQLQQMYTQFQDFSSKGVPALVQGVREEVRLRYEWGQDFDKNMAQVQQAFNTLPPQLQNALNSLEGARLIYSHISQQQQQQTQPLQSQAPRPMQGMYGAQTVQQSQQGQQKVPMSELLKLTPEQFNSPQVQSAIDQGLVDLNS